VWCVIVVEWWQLGWCGIREKGHDAWCLGGGGCCLVIVVWWLSTKRRYSYKLRRAWDTQCHTGTVSVRVWPWSCVCVKRGLCGVLGLGVRVVLMRSWQALLGLDRMFAFSQGFPRGVSSLHREWSRRRSVRLTCTHKGDAVPAITRLGTGGAVAWT
jgi:hypothetical protein